MTDIELNELYRDVYTFLGHARRADLANVDPVSAEERQWVIQTFTVIRSMTGTCQCGSWTHSHPGRDE